MAESSAPSPNEGGEALSALEKLTEVRVLLLILCLLFYLDIWLVRSAVDPTAITLEGLADQVKHVPVFTGALFVLTFSLLVGAAFPALRQLIGLARIYIATSVSIGPNRTRARRRMSDWALAFVAFSLYDAVAGAFSTGTYHGLSLHLVNLAAADGFESTVFRVASFFFWLVCIALAVEVDDPTSEA